ncbi:MAG TPA: PspC domain-containing protein [Acidimicrobiales bacterium]|nr:PspC domain-containing protein [Acidimicrobiales bacterium]
MTDIARSATTGSDEAPALRRPLGGRLVAGVAAGVADWLDLDLLLVRLAFVVLACLGGAAVPIYVAAWLLIPEEGAEASLAAELLDRGRSA